MKALWVWLSTSVKTRRMDSKTSRVHFRDNILWFSVTWTDHKWHRHGDLKTRTFDLWFLRLMFCFYTCHNLGLELSCISIFYCDLLNLKGNEVCKIFSTSPHVTWSKTFLFMASVTICSDFGAQENKVSHCFHCFPIYLPWSDGTGCHV